MSPTVRRNTASARGTSAAVCIELQHLVRKFSLQPSMQKRSKVYCTWAAGRRVRVEHIFSSFPTVFPNRDFVKVPSSDG